MENVHTKREKVVCKNTLVVYFSANISHPPNVLVTALIH